MAGTGAKKIAPATNSRAQTNAARLTGRRSFHAQAYSPDRRITPAPLGSLTCAPPRVGGILIRSGYGRPQPFRRLLSLTCHPYKFLVNLGQGAISHKELLGVAGAIFVPGARHGARRP